VEQLGVKKSLTGWRIYIQCRGPRETRERLFRSVWLSYRKRLTFFIRNFVRDEAEDIFQEVMLRVFQNIEKYNPLYPFSTWIYTIARNQSLNYLNKRKLPTEAGDTREKAFFSEAGDDSPEDKTIHRELHQTIDRALEGLSKENRQIAFLRFYEGMKHRDIARTLGIPTGTVKSRLFATRAILKEALEAYNET
jgi:RNA polymerase sigma-70 factor, ECF subfamily